MASIAQLTDVEGEAERLWLNTPPELAEGGGASKAKDVEEGAEDATMFATAVATAQESREGRLARAARQRARWQARHEAMGAASESDDDEAEFRDAEQRLAADYQWMDDEAAESELMAAEAWSDTAEWTLGASEPALEPSQPWPPRGVLGPSLKGTTTKTKLPNRFHFTVSPKLRPCSVHAPPTLSYISPDGVSQRYCS